VEKIHKRNAEQAIPGDKLGVGVLVMCAVLPDSFLGGSADTANTIVRERNSIPHSIVRPTFISQWPHQNFLWKSLILGTFNPMAHGQLPYSDDRLDPLYGFQVPSTLTLTKQPELPPHAQHAFVASRLSTNLNSKVLMIT